MDGASRTVETYDNSGRLLTSRDADGNTLTLGYNAAGLVSSATAPSGETVYYDYNASNQLTQIRTVSKSSAASGLDTTLTRVRYGYRIADGDTSLSVIPELARQLATRYEYDALGNLLSRTEAAGTTQARTTRYEYDALGRQVKTRFAAVGVYSGAANDVNASRSETTRELVTQTVYDAFGQAVANLDVSGNYSYKTYDQLGRVLLEIDANHGVTQHEYSDLVGQYSALVRMAGTASFSDGLSVSADVLNSATAMAKAVNPAGNRTVRDYFDQLGHISTVYDMWDGAFNYDAATNQSGVWTRGTYYAYNGFGDLDSKRLMLDRNGQTRQSIESYLYDLAGNVAKTVDAEGGVTQSWRNSFGEVTQTIEYANKIDPNNPNGTPADLRATAGGSSTIGFDRVTQMAYDRRGQLRSSTLVGTQLGELSLSNGTPVLDTRLTNVQTVYQYDGAGNVVQIFNHVLDTNGSQIEAGTETLNFYDALGRVVATTNGYGLGTSIRYDALGNAVQTTRSASVFGILVSAPAAGQIYQRYSLNSQPAADATNDQTTLTRYDVLGHVVQVRDAVNNNGSSSTYDRYLSYDAAGHAVKQWQAYANNDGLRTAVSLFGYDKVGQQTSTTTLTQRQSTDARTYIVDRAIYNTFGEVTQNTLTDEAGNTATTQQNWYDTGGRVWKTTSGGTTKVYWYDLQDHVTSAFTSTATTSGPTSGISLANFNNPQDLVSYGLTQGVSRTTTVYDRAGRTVSQNSTGSVHNNSAVTTSSSQVLDRWGNAISVTRNGVERLRYRYDAGNRAISEVQVASEVWAANGTMSTLNVEKRIYYDAWGHNIGNVDGEGHANAAAYNDRGQLTNEYHADKGALSYGYDNLGRLSTKIDTIGRTYTYGYNRADQETSRQVTYAGTTYILGSTSYDQMGRKQSSTSGDDSSFRGAIPSYDYDARGLMWRSLNALSNATLSWYDAAGHKAKEQDANGQITTWTYNLGTGLLSGHVDMGGASYSYGYNQLGQLTSQTNTRGQNLGYAFFEDGSLQKITDAYLGSSTTYDYDVDGNRTRETFVDKYGSTFRNTTSAYDRQGRLIQATDAAGTVYTNDGVPVAPYAIHIGYDAAGNRRRIWGTVVSGTVGEEPEFSGFSASQTSAMSAPLDDGMQTNVIIAPDPGDDPPPGPAPSPAPAPAPTPAPAPAPTPAPAPAPTPAPAPAPAPTPAPAAPGYAALAIDQWFTYNEVNLLLVDGGNLVNGVISDVGAQSYGYDAAGRRSLQTTKDVTGGTGKVQVYGYDFADRLNLQKSSTLTGALRTDRSIVYNASNATQTEQSFDYGTVVGNTQAYKRIDSYQVSNVAGQVVSRTDYITGLSTSTTTATGMYTQSYQNTNYDLAGNVASVMAEGYAPSGSGNANQVYATFLSSHSQYNYSYYLMDGYKERGQALTGYTKSSANSSQTAYIPSETGEDYDANGNLAQLRRTATNGTGYMLDNAGHILTSRTVTPVAWGSAGAPHTEDNVLRTWNPNTSTSSGSSGTLAAAPQLSYTYAVTGTVRTLLYLNDQQIGETTASNTRRTYFDEGGHRQYYTVYGRTAEIDLGGTRSTQPTSGSGQAYSVQEGDTTAALAQRFYGDASLWYVIADANVLIGDGTMALDAGQSIRIPQITRGTNSSQSFKVYNPSEIVGSTAPAVDLPPPPPAQGGGCGGLGMILIIVVAVVATVLTAGAAAIAMGAAAGTGISGVAAAGLSVLGGATVAGSAGLGLAAAAIGGAVGSIASQGVAMAMGMQDSFSWKQVGLGAIGAGVTAGMGSALQGSSLVTQLSNTAGQYAPVAFSAAASNAMTQGIAVATGLQDKFSWRSVAASAIAAPVAQAVGSQIFGAAAQGASMEFGERFARGIVSGVVSQSVRMLVTGQGKVDYASIAADAFGNAIGSSIADNSQPETVGGNGLRIRPGFAENWGPKARNFSDPVQPADYSLASAGPMRFGGPVADEPFVDFDNNDLNGTPRQVGVTGKEGAAGAWGIAKSLAGNGASNADVNRIKNQLLELNPELARVVQEGQRYYVPGGDTPENLAVARSADQQYQATLGSQKQVQSQDSHHPISDEIQNEGYIDNYTASAKLREIGVALRNPDAAMAIGNVERGALNISTVAARFGASIGLDETPSHEGSQVNAFRHVLWQAMITRDFGESLAIEVGAAHEENPYALSALPNGEPYFFPSLSSADESIDLLNNRIGRSIGLTSRGASTSSIALRVLDKFRDAGLWVAEEQPDGTFAVTRTKLSNEQYDTVRKDLVLRNDYGFTPAQWKLAEQQQRAFIESQRAKIMREPKF